MKIKVMAITISAQIGGGPKHILDQYENNPDVIVTVVCPMFGGLLTRLESISDLPPIYIPEGRFSFLYLFKLLKEVRARGIEIIHSHGKGQVFMGGYFHCSRGFPHPYTPWLKHHALWKNKKIDLLDL